MCCGRPSNPTPAGSTPDPRTNAVPGIMYQVLKLDGSRTAPVSTLAEAEAQRDAIGGEVRTVIDK